MNFKQFNFLNQLKSGENGDYSRNESSESSGLSVVNVDNGISSDNYFLLRIQELENRNAHLEKLVVQHTNRLSEVVATNTKFISIIGHDLRSPLNSILGVLKLLNEALNDYNLNELEKYINIASDSANSTLTLLDDLLAWTISQNKEKSFNPVKIKLHELLTNEIGSINCSAMQKHIMLNNSVAPHLNVTADLQMVKTVLRNLISNAIKFTDTGGEITISASESNQFVEIAVIDNGIGISSEAQRNLFKLDEYHSTPGTNNEKGTGLGLVICKEFVEMHGGNIRIDSEPGIGSRFTFSLPY